jgi:hypothetical protein
MQLGPCPLAISGALSYLSRNGAAMPPSELHILGIDPGGTTGWALVTIPRASLYEGGPRQIIDWDYDEITGPEVSQVKQLGRLAREIQGLSYQVGPAISIEDFDNATDVNDGEVFSPVRIGAMAVYAQSLGEFGDSHIIFQRRGYVKGHVTDDRLKRWKIMPKTPGGHAADAMRQAMMLLRRASASQTFRDSCWDYKACRL